MKSWYVDTSQMVVFIIAQIPSCNYHIKLEMCIITVMMIYLIKSTEKIGPWDTDESFIR